MNLWPHRSKNIIYLQSAVIPYRITSGQTEILLITSRKRKRWIIPKGLLEPDLSPQESAAKEAMEEAGIDGIVGDRIVLGEYRYKKWGGTCLVQVYPMEVTKVHSDWQESHFRSRRWCSITDAAGAIDESELRRIIAELPGWINSRPAS